ENNNDETPQETLDRVQSEINKVLQDELLTQIYQNSADFFEKMVIELMEKMGYGRGEVTQKSRDEGIDGI
ncbi:restriction endonuclease, partial [Acinetobacter baumannii]|nr:restriction endonuclease [Acinetobacter baumannii]